MTDKTLDLDALTPPTVTVRFNGEDHKVNPPTAGDIFQFGRLGEKLQDENMTPEQANIAEDKLKGIIRRCVPSIPSDAVLTTSQVLALMNLIAEMAVPPDTQELAKKGVTVGDPKATTE